MEKETKQLFTYLIVGGIATIAEWAAFYIFNTGLNINYMLATALAFILSTFVNWLAGRILMFKAAGKLLHELAKIYAVSILGLLWNLLIMWVAVEKFGISSNLSKVIATGLVFAWNYLVRKFLIYKV